MKSFSIGSHALVLGASSDIGAACAEMIALRGAKALTLTYSSSEMAVSLLATRLAREYGVLTRVVKLSFPLTDDDVLRFSAMLEESVTTLGIEIDAMVNAIGVSPNLDFAKQRISGLFGWDHVLAVNLTSAVFAMGAVADRMRRKGVRGAITQIASTNGNNSFAQHSAHYDASKSGLILSTRNLAMEFAKWGLRANSVSPGWVNTKLNHDVPNLDEEIGKIWLKRQGTVDEIAHAVAFTLENSFLTGANIEIDGGYPG